MQRTRARALAQEDPTCRGATKPICHNYWAHMPRAHAPQEDPLQRDALASHLEKAKWSNEDPAQPIVNKQANK